MLKRFAILAFALSTLALNVGCSSSGNPAGNQPNQGAGPGAQKPGGGQALSGTWCSNGQQQGADVQYRLNFVDAQRFDYMLYEITQGGRGRSSNKVNGTYTFDGTNLGLKFDNSTTTETFGVRVLNPDPTTGAARAFLKDPATGNESAWDPCS